MIQPLAVFYTGQYEQIDKQLVLQVAQVSWRHQWQACRTVLVVYHAYIALVS